MRFGPPVHNNPLGELITLQQTETVETYLENFQALLAQTYSIVPDHQVVILVAGLIDKIRLDVQMAKPTNLKAAMSLARTYEQKLLLDKPPEPKCTWQSARVTHSTPPPSQLATTIATPTFIKCLTRVEMAKRRGNGLCYNYDEQFTPSHSCKKVFWLEVTYSEEDGEYDGQDEGDTNPEIFIHALTGIKNAQTMQVQAEIVTPPVLILVDSGIHNFNSELAASQLGLPIKRKQGLQVAVANGENIPDRRVCEGVQVKLNSDFFTLDLFVIPLEAFDVVLGVRWLQTLKQIVWDFSTLTSFRMGCKEIQWEGVKTGGSIQLHTITTQLPPHAMMDKLLINYQELFVELTELPPQQTYDPKINLVSGTNPMVVRPCQYSFLQKDEIEKQCVAMLSQGIIRPSQYPLSLSVLLVKKHDGLQRFCIDYQELNSKIITDKFLSPVPTSY